MFRSFDHLQGNTEKWTLLKVIKIWMVILSDNYRFSLTALTPMLCGRAAEWLRSLRYMSRQEVTNDTGRIQQCPCISILKCYKVPDTSTYLSMHGLSQSCYTPWRVLQFVLFRYYYYYYYYTIRMSLVTRLFFLVLLLNQQWTPSLRLQASHCFTLQYFPYYVWCSKYSCLL
jgi:hypothetical protein